MGGDNGLRHGRRARRSFRRAIVAAATGGLMVAALCRPVPALGTTYVRAVPSSLGFPIGWYTGSGSASALPEISGDGMRSVVSYHSAYSQVRPYLDAASAQGIKVWIEIPRPLVKAVDTSSVASFVKTHAGHSALMGWYLADEPSTNSALGPLSAENATKLYGAIKEADPVHPISMAFHPAEPAASYHSAMDVMMEDYYPCLDGMAEFSRLGSWTASMRKAAAVAANEPDFFPIIQAFGGIYGYRLPTLAEERYMVYASLQMGATGMYFWAHYRSDREWVGRVLAPTVKDLNEMRPALAYGEASGLVTDSRTEVTTTAYRDRATGKTFVVAVNNSAATIDAPLTFADSITSTKAARLGPNPTTVYIKYRKLAQKLGPYGVHVYRLL